MPGITIADKKFKTKFLQFGEHLLEFSDYKNYSQEIIYEDDQLFISNLSPENYRVFNIKINKWVLIVEGINSSQFKQVSKLLEENLNGSVDSFCERVQHWVTSYNWEFVIYLYNSEQYNLIVINDRLGRLSLFYDQSVLLISRYFSFLAKVADLQNVDKYHIAEYLIFGYNLGNRTLYDTSFKMNPGAVLTVQTKNNHVKESIYYQWYLEDENNYGLSTNATQLAETFENATKEMTENYREYTYLLSLSGGLDSRAVAAALKNNGTGIRAVTFQYSDKENAKDAAYAARIAQSLDIPIEQYQIQRPQPMEFEQIIALNAGLSNINLSEIFLFLRQLVKNYPVKPTYITGDGGDKALPYFNTYLKLRDIDDLVNRIIKHNAIYSLEKAANLLDIKQSNLFAWIRNHLIEYPEESLHKKHYRFYLFERAFRWAFEGEDRNRSFLPSLTPFYSFDFFDYATKCPDRQKFDFLLYSKFLENLNEKVASIPYPKYSQAINSVGFRFKSNVRYLILQIVNNLSFSGLLESSQSTISSNSTEARNCSEVVKSLSKRKHVEKLLPGINETSIQSKSELINLLTLLAALERNDFENEFRKLAAIISQ